MNKESIEFHIGFQEGKEWMGEGEKGKNKGKEKDLG